MFSQDNCFELGNITRPHGYSGEVLVFIDSDNPSHYKKIKSVFVEINGQLVPHFISKIQVLPNGNAIIQFDDVKSIEQASSLVYCKLYLPLDQLPKLKGNEFYLHEIIGFTMNDIHTGNIGIITQYYEAKGQDLIAVDYNGIEILVPKNPVFIKSIDRDNKVLNVELPEGYTEVFTSTK